MLGKADIFDCVRDLTSFAFFKHNGSSFTKGITSYAEGSSPSDATGREYYQSQKKSKISKAVCIDDFDGDTRQVLEEACPENGKKLKQDVARIV
mmetsp:Transcript_29703/g.32873  ORF Transcript_29703/g.32873 Transcript_29703/m.32873 type:complete len:94 (+) Transcript_29703:850-1131(+)